MKMEIRDTQTTLSSNGDLVVSGYVNKPGQLSEILGVTQKFREKIAPGAFQKAIENRSKEIDFLAEHDSKKVLSSTRNDSLTLREEQEGLYMDATISQTSWGRDYYQLITDGLIGSMSFGFRSIRDSWSMEDGLHIRTVHELELYEISAVKDPAYSQSMISARNIDLVKDIEIPKEKEFSLNRNAEYYDNNQEERGEQFMKKMETRTNEFESILRGETRALQTTTSGAALIPENTHNDIVLKMEEISPVFAKARKLNSVAGTLRVTREDDSVTAGFFGEGQEILESAIGFKQVDSKQKRVGAALTLSNQLFNDSAVNIADYSKNLLARRAGKTVEKSILVGLGGDEFAGIVPDADVQSVDVVGTATLEDLQELYLKVHPEFLTGGSFIMSRDFFNQIAKLKDANGHYYVQMGTVNGKIQYVLFGMPVDVTDALPAATPAVFGNIAEAYAVMIKQEAGIQEIVDSGLALKGAKLYVYDAFMDGAVVNPAAIVKLNVAQA
ncbi:phage major capsid protein [Halobacillus litoralis]|uniref:Phage major capsid protein n=1 Tax=Halobacillus litoralis TaxID=45668 RepID=A0A410MAS4_9BACI|nr:phage major capsid protein [Halobacillus litoralis]QAS51829.1 phage major capsid protein [Halobacillus litoralis]